MPRPLIVTGLLLLTGACATLGRLGAIVQAPRFDEAPGQPAEIRLLSPSTDRAYGGAGVRLWAKVTNPNPFGLTLSTLHGTLFLEDSRAATAELPLGLPLSARGETTLPIDLSISFADIPALADVVRRAVSRQPIGYRFEGTVGVDAGHFGTPVFGPMTFLRGTIRGTEVFSTGSASTRTR